MKKWFALCRLEIIRSLEWRAETLLWVILDIFPTLVFAIVWFAIFATSQPLQIFHSHSLWVLPRNSSYSCHDRKSF